MLRPRSAGNNDYGVAYEVFVHRYYAPLRPIPENSVRLIVDLGANVGFSCLYWLTQFPEARLIALEPHPGHMAQCRANLAANGMLSRVTLHAAAAGVTPSRITLTDKGSASAVVTADANGIQADMLDIFSLLDGCAVDLLKIDIEGGEHAILADPRFPRLRVSRLVMEWHGEPASRAWCLARLDESGYETVEIFDQGSHGMLWAFRRQTADRGSSRPCTPLDGSPI
jgi:FkbM family methyltransferase